MEKQITFSEIRGVFTKDYDTFGKMDPFLEFSCDKSTGRTQTAHKAGKEPKWKDSVVLKFYEQQTTILVKGWEEDTASNDYIGQAKIDINTLKASGDLEFKLIEDDGKPSGTIYCKYAVKALPGVPTLVIRNIRCEFYKDTEFVLKTKPFLTLSTNGSTDSSATKDKGDSKQLTWNQTLRAKIKDGERIDFNLQDKNDLKTKIFSYGVLPKQFRTTSGKKKFNVHGYSFDPLGTLEFDYETFNFVTKQQSAKTEQSNKKQDNQLTKITIQSIKGNLNETANDLFFKIVSGSNLTRTTMLAKAPKDFTMEVKKIIYTDRNENKLVFSAYNQQNVGGNTFYGSGQLWLDKIVEGNNTIKIINRRDKHFGDIIVNISTKKVPFRELNLTDIKVKYVVSADIVGQSDLYVIGRIGGCACQTQTIQGKEVAFKKNLNFKFSEQKQIKFQIMDKDITKDDLIIETTANLEDFKQSGEMTVPLIPEKYKNDATKHGFISFKYKVKNNIFKEKKVEATKKSEPAATKEEPKKQQPKKEEPKKQQPKKVESKKQEPKKQELKKQEPKKQEPKKEELKKEEPKKEEPKKEESKKVQVKKQEPKKQQQKKVQPKKQQQPKKPSQKKIPAVQQKPPSSRKLEAEAPAQKFDPNVEKQITITDLRGMYLKDFDTFGKMDPFLTFKLGKQQQNTEVAHDAGKECSWKNTIILKYYEDTNLNIKSFDEDVSSKDLMGEANIDLKTLKAKGDLEIKIFDNKKQHTGTIFGKYTCKVLPAVPALIIKSVKCSFYKDTEFVLKSKPFFTVASGNKSASTESQKGDARSLTWNEQLRVKINNDDRIFFHLEDKNDENKKIFSYDASPKQFRTTSGTKTFNVLDSSYEQLGTLNLNYETQNFVSKEESAKTEQAAKKASAQLTQVTIESIKGNLNDSIYDLYFKINCGQNSIKTKPIDKAPKDFNLDVKQTIYAESTENKIVFAAYDQEMTKDSFKGSGEILLQKLVDGKNTVKLLNQKGQHIGDIIVNTKVKKTPYRELTITEIKLNVKKSADIVGDPQMYIVAQVAGSTRRTQTTSGKQVTFKQPLNFKYSEQKQISLIVYDEDVTKDDLLHQVNVNIEDLTDKGELKMPLTSDKKGKDGKEQKEEVGELIIKYEGKNLTQKQKVPPKKEQKKQQPVKKKEQPKKEEPKKQQPKKQQPKKQETKKPIINETKLQQSGREQKNKSIDNSRSIDKSKMQRSRNTIKLPNIVDSKNYGDRIFEKQSSSTLQKSIHVYTMPRAHRFANGPKYTGEPTYVMDSCFKTSSTKGVGFGFGNKRQFPEWMERNMKENPAPGAYLEGGDSKTEYHAKGPTFGIPYKYYEKVTIPKQKSPSNHVERKSPEKLGPVGKR